MVDQQPILKKKSNHRILPPLKKVHQTPRIRVVRIYTETASGCRIGVDCASFDLAWISYKGTYLLYKFNVNILKYEIIEKKIDFCIKKKVCSEEIGEKREGKTRQVFLVKAVKVQHGKRT